MKSLRFFITVGSIVSLLSIVNAQGDPIHYVSPMGSHSSPYSTWGTAAHDIQSAVNESVDGDMVMVSNGVYSIGTNATPGYTLPCRVVITNAVMVQSVNGPSLTTITGLGPVSSNASVRCAYLSGNAVLSGFTLASGSTLNTGDLYFDQRGGGVLLRPGATISNCVVEGCAANTYAGGVYCYGGGSIVDSIIRSNTALTAGGVHSSGGTILNTLVQGNQAGSGGGLYLLTFSRVEHCTIVSNMAASAAGGIYIWDYSTVSNSTIAFNQATNVTGVGGGLEALDGLIDRCTVNDNHAGADGGGVYMQSGGILRNSVLFRNDAGNDGGGVKCLSGGTVENCTIANNMADSDKSVSGSGGGLCANVNTHTNNILFFNRVFSGTSSNHYLTGSAQLDHAATMPASGSFCVTQDPVFADTNASNYRLQWGSPCADAGTNLEWMVGGAADRDGEARILSVSVDIGAYELNPDADSDGDGLRDAQESQLGTSPTNAADPAVATHYVWPASPTPLFPFTNWTTAAHDIQSAVDWSRHGDTVLVTNGIYDLTNQITVANGIAVQSVGGTENTIVDGNFTTRCFQVSHSEAVVRGFTIRQASNTLDGVGGGVWISAGTIHDCVMISNRAGQGGGAYLSYGGVVSNCIVQENAAESGGGIWCEYGGVVRDSLVVSNTAAAPGDGRAGGVRLYHGGRIEGCTLVGNLGYGGGGGSALRFDYGGVATNCTITRNVSVDGAGVIRFTGASGAGALYDCTISSNYSSGEAVFFDYSGNATAANCRIIGNIGGDGPGGCSYMKGCTMIENQATNGSGGGLTLEPGWQAIGCIIVSNRAAQGGGGVQMSQGSSLLSCTTRWNQATWGGGVNCWGGSNTLSGCTIADNVATNGNGGGISCGAEDIIEGSTISSNLAACGGGIFLSQGGLITDCLIVGNVATQFGGGGVNCGNGGTVSNCIIRNNRADQASGGGGFLFQTGLVQNCTITANSAVGGTGSGGGLGFGEGGLARNCTISSNSATSGGGGVSFNSGGTLRDCAVIGNSTLISGGGGGVDCYHGGAVSNCLIINNSSGWGGGVKCNNGGIVDSCTISSNTANQGGGAQLDFAATLCNSILFGNSSGNGANYYTDGSAVFLYTCTTPAPGGTSNIVADPLFVSAAGGDFRLATNSPCLDRGTNEAWMTTATDLGGRDRLLNGTADMGCYELIPHAWDNNTNGMPDYWEWENFSSTNVDALADADMDKLNNVQEYVAGTDPNNPFSVLTVYQPEPVTGESTNIVLRWASVEGKSYDLQRSTNLMAVPAFANRVTNILGQATLTVYTDTVSTAESYFYRVRVK